MEIPRNEERYAGLRVLVVDDDGEITEAISKRLEDEFRGISVLKSYDGFNAFDQAVNSKPKVIILDAMLPQRSGFMVLEKLGKHSKLKGKEPYVIMITANTGARHRDWAKSLGAEEYITKPFEMEKLMNKVGDYLGRGI